MASFSSKLSAAGLHPPSSAIVVILIVTLVVITVNTRASHRRGQLPPGPKPLPVIGNLLDIPLSEEWLTWQKHVQQYGDLVYLNALGRNYLLLGSWEAITELLEKRSHFNDRPHLTMLSELMNLEWLLPVTPYGEYWRRSRKLMHSQTHLKAAESYRPHQIRGARRLVGDLLAAEPNRPADKLSDAAKAVLPHMVRYNFAHTALDMIYGIDVRDKAMEARFVEPAETTLRYFSQGTSPGQFIVDFIPLLKYIPSWVPGAGFQRIGQETTKLGRAAIGNPLQHMKAEIASSGSAPVVMAAEMLKKSPDDEELVKEAAGTVYLGGSDTTVSTVTSYFLAMVTYPEVQKRAQEEIDRVVGRERFADFADKGQLPYLEAVIRECLRWNPVVPIPAAHVSMQDDEYRGYFIPKGTIALAFQWGLLHDPNTYPNPSVFSPERYLNRLSDGTWKLKEDVPDPRKFSFGYGRRVCPGMHIAEQSMFSILTTVLQTLDIKRAKDDDGQEVVPEALMSSGLLSHPLPFPYAISARTDAQHLISQCVAAANK